MSAYVPPSDAKGTRRVDSGKLGGRLHSGFIGNKAPSALEAHWLNPRMVSIGVLVVGRWMLLPFRTARSTESKGCPVVCGPAQRRRGSRIDCSENPFCWAENGNMSSGSSGCTASASP